jgi:nicotinamidase-related amidase
LNNINNLEDPMDLAHNSQDFLEYLENWLDDRPTLSLGEAIPKPENSAIISIDVINGFLYEGPLSSPRVAAIDDPITRLMKAAWEKGLRDILLVQEGHSEDSLEFDAFGEHAVRGTHQAQAIDKIKNLPFYDRLTTVYKDSVHPALNNGFDEWVESRGSLDTFIAVGDVTDICVYQLAMYLKLQANAYHQERRVIVPANCTQTWHLSVQAAEELPAMPHHGDLMHAIFLYHMALNGVEVVKAIQA